MVITGKGSLGGSGKSTEMFLNSVESKELVHKPSASHNRVEAPTCCSNCKPGCQGDGKCQPDPVDQFTLDPHKSQQKHLKDVFPTQRQTFAASVPEKVQAEVYKMALTEERRHHAAALFILRRTQSGFGPV